MFLLSKLIAFTPNNRKKFALLIITCFLLANFSTSAQLKQEITTSGPTCSIPQQTTAQCTRCSLTEWAKKIRTLKERPIEFSSLPSKQDYQKNVLTLIEFMSTLQTMATAIANDTKQDSAWLNKKSVYSIAPELFTLDRPFVKPAIDISNFPFKPYAQRLFLKPDSQLALFGDLHGSVHSLIRDLEKLQAEGYLDDQFKILKDNFAIVFLGDYIDRGIYGVEVIYTLARLKIANSRQVILVRGNHEDYILAPDFLEKHTTQEEKDNAPSFIDELYRKFDMSVKEEVTIYRLYETLPVVLYLGSGSTASGSNESITVGNGSIGNGASKNGSARSGAVENISTEGGSTESGSVQKRAPGNSTVVNGSSFHQDYMQCCHAGLEIGYNPYKLLHAPMEIRFELIEELSRKKNFEKLSPRSKTAIKSAFDLDILCNDIRDFVPLAPFFKIPGTEHVAYLGFMWNDFFVNPSKIVGQRKKKFTGWVCGKDLTEDVLSWGNSKNVTLQGVFRAHQHNNETGGPMLNLLCCSKGIAHIWNKNVYTLVSAPNSKLDDTGEQCFTYDSFVLLTLAPGFAQWKMVHHVRDNGMENKVWTTKTVKQGPATIYQEPKKPYAAKKPGKNHGVQQERASCAE